jgi:hypothetical protein
MHALSQAPWEVETDPLDGVILHEPNAVLQAAE